MFLFGKLKSASTIEQERLLLSNEYQVYTEVEGSKKLNDFLVLKEKVESTPFQARRKEIESLRYKGSPEEKLVKQFSKLEKSPKLIDYFKTADSSDLKKFRKITENGLSEQINELQNYLKSGRYKRDLNNFKKEKKSDKTSKDTWESTETYKKDREYKELINSADYLFAKRFEKSSSYKNFLSVENSSLKNQFKDLKDEVNSEKFKTRKAYLEDRNRYLKTVDYNYFNQYQELKKDEGIKLYFKYNDTDAFKFFREWKITIDEDFTTPIKKSEWSFVTPVAESGPGKNFSVKGQLQYYNLDDNFEVDNHVLTLEAHNQKIEGLYWDEEFGFIIRDFDYASGVMHSLNFFRQEYGQFEVKLKASKIKGVISSVSLVDENEDVCIRLVSLESHKATGGLIYTDHGQKVFSRVNLNFKPSGYVIVGIEWSPKKIEWKVNDRVVGSITQNIPHEKLGLRIETEVVKQTSNLPHRLDIDWIKCYQSNS
jgi:hypothetical protein